MVKTYGIWNGAKFLNTDSGNTYQSESYGMAEAHMQFLLSDGAANLEVREIPSDLHDHMAYSCGECGSVGFNLLRSGKIECTGCKGVLSATWQFA